MPDPVSREEIDTALFAYWTSRADAQAAQRAKGVADVGGRAGATSGGHLDQVARLLAAVARAAGAPAEAVFYRAPKGDPFRRDRVARGFTLPGHYRPDKQWDLVVWHQDVPIVVVELKSQNGPSYGNNANNRAEEAIGNAIDLRRAVQENLFPNEPWVGYAFVIESDPSSELSHAPGVSRLPIDPAFKTWSYVSRIATLSSRLVAEGLYDAAWVVASSRPDCPGEECPILKAQARMAQWEEKVAAAAAKGKISRAKRPAEPPVHAHTFGWHEPDPARLGFDQLAAEMSAVIRLHYGSA